MLPRKVGYLVFMRLTRLALLGAVLLLTGLAGLATAQVSRPPCRQVLGEVNKEVSLHEGNPASPRAVARRMGTETEWVQRCMEAYGRVPSERTRLHDSDREAFERALEEGRPVDKTEDTTDLSYDKQEQLRVERAEMRQRKKVLAQQKDFEESAESFAFPDHQY